VVKEVKRGRKKAVNGLNMLERKKGRPVGVPLLTKRRGTRLVIIFRPVRVRWFIKSDKRQRVKPSRRDR